MSPGIRLYTPEDYETVCRWWTEWGWPCLPTDSLPDLGMIGLLNDEPKACAWLYQTDSSLAWVAFPISTKKLRGKQRHQVLDYMLCALCDLAKVRGFKFVNALTNSASLGARYERLGFGAFDQNITHYLKEV